MMIALSYLTANGDGTRLPPPPSQRLLGVAMQRGLMAASEMLGMAPEGYRMFYTRLLLLSPPPVTLSSDNQAAVSAKIFS